MPAIIRRPTRAPMLVPPEPERPRAINHADLPRALPPDPPGPIVFKLGTALLDRAVPFGFSTEYSKVHVAILGESGTGKSKLIELLQRYKLMAGQGGMFVDPANDSADETLAFIAYRYKIGDEALVRRCHVLTIQKDLRFRYDPGADLPPRTSVSRQEYVELLDARAERVLRSIVRRLQGTDLEVMNRFLPRAKAVIMACLVDYDGRGRHIGLGEASVFCNPGSPRFAHHMGLVFPHLPADQQDVFREIRAERVTQSVRDRWESTQNRFNRALSPAVKLATGEGPSIDIKKAIANREYIIVRAKPSPRLPADAAATMTGLLIDGYLQAKEAEEDVPPYLRVPSSLTIDEVGDYLSESLVFGLCNDRKSLNEITLGAQNFMRLCNDNVALGDFVLTQCGTVFCLAQRGQSSEFVVERMFRGNESYTQRLRKVQRQYGWFTVQTPDYSVSGNETKGMADNRTWGGTETHSEAAGKQTATVANWGRTQSAGMALGSADMRGDSVSQGSNAVTTLQPIIVNGVVVANTPTRSSSANAASARQRNHTDSKSLTSGTADTEGGAVSEGESEVEGHAIARMQGGGHTDSQSRGTGWTLSIKTGLMPNQVWEYEWDGGYEEGPPEVQRAAFARWLHALDTAECFVSVRGCPYAFPVKIDHVEELWASPALKWHAIQIITRTIAAQHDYTFSPATLSCEDTPVAPVPQVGGREFADDEENPIA